MVGNIGLPAKPEEYVGTAPVYPSSYAKYAHDK